MQDELKVVIGWVLICVLISAVAASCTCTSSVGMHTRQEFRNNGGCEWHRN